MSNGLNATKRKRHASRTALGVAALRAVHQLIGGALKILDDPIAALLLDDDDGRQLLARVRVPDVVALRSRVLLRSFAEERMAEAVRRGVRQCVVLGAGFDTFAYRQPEWARSPRIYQVDHLATQTEKHRRLQKAGVPMPTNLEFGAIDFESMSLHDGLRTSSLDFSQPAFFSCLGVPVYLTRAAADAIFVLVGGFPAGSEIAFTFSTPDAAISNWTDGVKHLGEPWRTHFEADALMRDLHALGFSEILFLTPMRRNKRISKAETTACTRRAMPVSRRPSWVQLAAAADRGAVGHSVFCVSFRRRCRRRPDPRVRLRALATTDPATAHNHQGPPRPDRRRKHANIS
jgi:methyltransferase (TIGR00027 family)